MMTNDADLQQSGLLELNEIQARQRTRKEYLKEFIKDYDHKYKLYGNALLPHPAQGAVDACKAELASMEINESIRIAMSPALNQKCG